MELPELFCYLLCLKSVLCANFDLGYFNELRVTKGYSELTANEDSTDKDLIITATQMAARSLSNSDSPLKNYHGRWVNGGEDRSVTRWECDLKDHKIDPEVKSEDTIFTEVVRILLRNIANIGTDSTPHSISREGESTDIGIEPLFEGLSMVDYSEFLHPNTVGVVFGVAMSRRTRKAAVLIVFKRASGQVAQQQELEAINRFRHKWLESSKIGFIDSLVVPNAFANYLHYRKPTTADANLGSMSGLFKTAHYHVSYFKFLNPKAPLIDLALQTLERSWTIDEVRSLELIDLLVTEPGRLQITSFSDFALMLSSPLVGVGLASSELSHTMTFIFPVSSKEGIFKICENLYIYRILKKLTSHLTQPQLAISHSLEVMDAASELLAANPSDSAIGIGTLSNSIGIYFDTVRKTENGPVLSQGDAVLSALEKIVSMKNSGNPIKSPTSHWAPQSLRKFAYGRDSLLSSDCSLVLSPDTTEFSYGFAMEENRILVLLSFGPIPLSTEQTQVRRIIDSERLLLNISLPDWDSAKSFTLRLIGDEILAEKDLWDSKLAKNRVTHGLYKGEYSATVFQIKPTEGEIEANFDIAFEALKLLITASKGNASDQQKAQNFPIINNFQKLNEGPIRILASYKQLMDSNLDTLGVAFSYQTAQLCMAIVSTNKVWPETTEFLSMLQNFQFPKGTVLKLNEPQNRNEAESLALAIQKDNSIPDNGFGISNNFDQWSYVKLPLRENVSIATQVAQAGKLILEDAFRMKETCWKQPTPIFSDTVEINETSVVILQDMCYSYYQLYGQVQDIRFGWHASETQIVTVLVSRIPQLAEQGTYPDRAIYAIHPGYKPSPYNLSSLVHKFQAMSLGRKLLELEGIEDFKGLCVGPGFQASISLDSVPDPEQKGADTRLGEMFEAINANRKTVGTKLKVKGQLASIFLGVHEGYSNIDYYAVLEAEQISYANLNFRGRRASVVLYYNTFSTQIQALRQKFSNNDTFKMHDNADQIYNILEKMKPVFLSVAKGFGILEDKYAVSFKRYSPANLPTINLDQRRLGHVVMDSFIKHIGNTVACNKVALQLKPHVSPKFVQLFTDISSADLAQIIGPSTNEISGKVVEVNGIIIAVIISTVSAGTLGELPFFAFHALQQNPFIAKVTDAGEGIKAIAEKCLKKLGSESDASKMKMEISKKDAYGIAVKINLNVEECDINPTILEVAIRLHCVEELSWILKRREKPFRMHKCVIDSKVALGQKKYISAVVILEDHKSSILAEMKAQLGKILGAADNYPAVNHRLDSKLCSAAEQFAKKFARRSLVPGFSFSGPNLTLTSIVTTRNKGLSEIIAEFISSASQVLATDDYVYNDLSCPAYQPVYSRITSADLFQMLQSKDVGIAEFVSKDKFIFIFAYYSKLTSAECLLPLVNSHRPQSQIPYLSLQKHTTFGEFSNLFRKTEPNGIGLIITKNVVVTYKIIKEYAEVNEVFAELFQFGQAILDKSVENEKVVLPWSEVDNSSSGMTYSFLAPETDLSDHRKMLTEGDLRGMHMIDTEYGLAFQLIYAATPCPDEDSRGVRITKAAGKVYAKIEMNSNASENQLLLNRIANTVLSTRLNTVLDSRQVFFVTKNVFAVIVAYNKPKGDFIIEKCAQTIIDEVMRSGKDFSFFETQEEKLQQLQLKSSFFSTSSDTFQRNVSGEDCAGFAIKILKEDKQEFVVGAMVFKPPQLSVALFNVLSNWMHKTAQWKTSATFDFFANELAAQFASTPFGGNYGEGDMLIMDTRTYVISITEQRNSSEAIDLQQLVADRLKTLLDSDGANLLVNNKLRGSKKYTLRQEKNFALCLYLQTGGNPTLIPELKLAVDYGFGTFIKSRDDGIIEYFFVAAFKKP